MADKTPNFIPFPGENELWEKLSLIDKNDVCKKADVNYIYHEEAYEIKILNCTYKLSLDKKTIPEMHPHLRFITLLYLVEAKDISPTGKWIALHEIKGGQFFFRGGHELPLNKIANKFGKDIELFNNKGISLGGQKYNFGDASICLYPFPKIPLIYILWKENDEFPANISILFDETAEKQMLLEGLWGIAFFTALQFMIG